MLARIVAQGASGMMAGMPQNPLTLYGIRNCDTVKKARQWLAEHAIDYQFHDYKLQGVPVGRLDQWLMTTPWETLLNRQGNTWRKLDEATQASVVDATSARVVMLAYPSLIKRPVVEWSGDTARDVTVGFKPQAWAARVNR